MQPTVQMPVSTGFLGMYNQQAAMRNVQFAAWLDALIAGLRDGGSKVEVQYIPGGVNSYYTLGDSAWLTIDGFFVYAPIAMMVIVADPVAWAKTQVSNQRAFGRIPGPSPADNQ